MATALSRELSGEEISNNKTPNDESAFQNWIRGTDWFKEFKAEYNEEPDLDTKDYDYRAAWKAGVQPERDPYDNNRFHWPSSLPTGEMLKSAEHPTAWKEYFMRETGVNPDALGLKTQEDANIYLKKKSDQKAPINKGSAMSTTLDRINNPLSPLGLTSLMGSPNKENPAAPKFGEDDVGTMEGMLSAGRSRLANLQTQETSFSTEKANLTSRLANLTSEQLAYNRQKEEFGAKQRLEESRANYDNIKKIFDDEINSPQYKEKQRINKEIAEYQVFAPTEVTAPMLGVLFAAIGATGMLLGGNSKNNAKAALSAMNGMAEGFGEGRRQYDKERKAAFDTNVKLLQTKLSAIKDGLEDARREAVLNKQAADQKVRETLAVNEAQFLQENTNKRGLESTIALVNGQLTNINQATNLLSSKISQLTGQLDSKETQILMRKIDAARRESEARIREEGRAENARQRHLDRMSEMRLQAGLRPDPGVQPIGMADGQLMVMDKSGNISSRPLPEGFKGAGKLAEKGGTSLKPGAKLQEGYVAQNIFASDITEMKNQLQDPDLQKLIKNYRPEAFFSEKSDYLDQLLSTNLPPKLNKFLTTIKDFRNNYYLDKSGKAVTGGEALRNYGVVPQPGDTAERMSQKFDGLEKRVKNQIAINQQLYGFPELKIPSGTSTGLVPNQSYGISAQESSGPKEGDEAPSKSGKPMVFKNGSWEYKQ